MPQSRSLRQTKKERKLSQLKIARQQTGAYMGISIRKDLPVHPGYTCRGNVSCEVFYVRVACARGKYAAGRAKIVRCIIVAGTPEVTSSQMGARGSVCALTRCPHHSWKISFVPAA